MICLILLQVGASVMRFIIGKGYDISNFFSLQVAIRYAVIRLNWQMEVLK